MQLRPALTWKYVLQIEKATRGKKPNRAHHIVREMEDHFDHVVLLTQNIDGLHHHVHTFHNFGLHVYNFRRVA